MEIIEINYHFTMEDGSIKDFDLLIDPHTLTLCNSSTEAMPSWTELSCHKCPICKLKPETSKHCPLSANLVEIVTGFSDLVSHDQIHVEVVTPERKVIKDTTAQQGISSLMGLCIAASACPVTDFLKPMARFHLPFASEEETIFRAISTYLLFHYFMKCEGEITEMELSGLSRVYKNMQIVNSHIAKRLRGACKKDSTINAVILLDLFAKAMPPVIEESLEEFRHLFVPFISEDFKAYIRGS